MKNKIKKKTLKALLKLNDVSYFTIRNTLTEYNIITQDDYIEFYDFVKHKLKSLKATIRYYKILYEDYGEPLGSTEYFDDNEVFKCVYIGGYEFFYKKNYTNLINTLEFIIKYFDNVFGESYVCS